MNQSHDATCLPSASSDNDGHTDCAPSPLSREPAGECVVGLTFLKIQLQLSLPLKEHFDYSRRLGYVLLHCAQA